MTTRIITKTENKFDQLINFLEFRMATHEGGAGTISISWDDATRDWIISQQQLGKSGRNETLGYSRSLKRAIELAVTGKIYDEE